MSGERKLPTDVVSRVSRSHKVRGGVIETVTDKHVRGDAVYKTVQVSGFDYSGNIVFEGAGVRGGFFRRIRLAKEDRAVALAAIRKG